ncbi:MAG TPA: hypothetical protein VMS56_12030, partial [Thermoanaerobaculia bacterium]|nr:hypothetical protein [Thermoanaerobaculia bacterium]
KELGANGFLQQRADQLLGIELSPNDSIRVRVEEGTAVVYGATTDNVTQDPSLQIARRTESVEGELRILPVVGSLEGAHGSFFRTSLQLHNPADVAIEGRLVFHLSGQSGSADDPALLYRLAPGETVAFDDLLPAMGQEGIGSVDLVSVEGPLPLSVARIFNDAGEAGTTGMTEEQVALGQVLAVGEHGLLIAPPNPDQARFNIGVRTLGEGAELEIVVRNSSGTVVQEISRSYEHTFFSQTSAAVFLGIAPGPSDVIEIRVTEGSAIVYGATTDNITQDPSLQMAH